MNMENEILKIKSDYEYVSQSEIERHVNKGKNDPCY